MRIAKWMDASGIAASGLCAVHCASMTLLFSLNPLLMFNRQFYRDWGALLYWSEILLASFSLMVAVSMLIWGLRQHGRKLPAAFLTLGGIALAVGIFSATHRLAHWGLLIVVSGGVLLIVGHSLNMRCLQKTGGPG